MKAEGKGRRQKAEADGRRRRQKAKGKRQNQGEVYRARDTRLDRTVAIQVLAADFASEPDAKQRFEREARVISSLSHPHICTLHDIGHHDSIEFW